MATSLDALRAEAAGCRACPLWQSATQTVFGEGPRLAALMLVGEQPGDHEDLEGRPFVGPAGALLDRALEEAGIERSTVYLTNAVKHFKWTPKGKRRIHQKPNAAEVEACRPWLEAEIAAVRPTLVVALGAVAAQALLGRGFRVTRHRGEVFPQPEGPPITATVHPSSILRAPTAPPGTGRWPPSSMTCGPSPGGWRRPPPVTSAPMQDGSRKAIIAAFFANLGIAIAKFVGFLLTGATSMLAEAVHSVADSSNQGLLLLGGNRARRRADVEHPFGYGRERYFWSFVVALVIFMPRARCSPCSRA